MIDYKNKLTHQSHTHRYLRSRLDILCVVFVIVADAVTVVVFVVVDAVVINFVVTAFAVVLVCFLNAAVG